MGKTSAFCALVLVVCAFVGGVGAIPALAGEPTDVEKCKAACDTKANMDHRKCEKKTAPGSPERAKCRQAAEERRVTCYRKCEREAK